MRISVLLILLLLLTGCRQQVPSSFVTEVLNGYTPVKNQGKSQTCWAYAMLAAIETEHIMRGDSVHLSPAYVEMRMTEDRRAPKSKRGMGQTLLNLIQRYGIVGYDAMNTIDTPAPRWVFLYGAQYTPVEFAHSVCAPDEYIALTTTAKYPSGKEVVLEVPDNWEYNRFLNIPADSLLAHTARAVRQHHGVCWEGDISERGFSFEAGIADLSLINGRTTDDHCMSIVGIAHNPEGKRFFILKNSWGTDNPYGGLMYMSFDYFKAKTIAVYLTKEAFLSSR